MIQFLRLHARDLDFDATVIKPRQFADATGQSKPKKRVNFIDNRPKSPAQPEWEPLLQGFKEMMAEALQPLQRDLRSQTQVTTLVKQRLPHLSRALPRLNSTRRREGHGRISSSVTVKATGAEMLISLVERLVGSFSLVIADHRLHRTHNGSSSNVPPRCLRLIVHVAGLNATCAVTNVVTPRFISAMELCRPTFVVHRLPVTMNAIVEPPLA